MVNKLSDGDYTIGNDNRLCKVQYTDELLQRATVALNAVRGRFYPNKDFGMRPLVTNLNPLVQYAVSYAAEALDKLDGVYVKNAMKVGNKINFTLLINKEERQVDIDIEQNV